MRCPNCGAANPDSAQWCGQCLLRFDEPADAAQPAETAPTQPAALPAEQTAASGTFRRRGDEIEWACPSCGEFNSIDLMTCAVCGTAFVDRFKTESDEPPRNWSQAMAMSAFAPGAGHLAIGRYGSGWARLLLFVSWALGAWLLASGAGSRALLAISPLLVGAAIVWAGSLVDLYRLQRGEEELLAGRRLLWLVVGILMLLGVSLFAALSAGPG